MGASASVYREVGLKGVPHLNFMALLDNMYRSHDNREGSAVVDLTKGCGLHPYDDEYWQFPSSNPETINCPLYIVSSLADNGLHTYEDGSLLSLNWNSWNCTREQLSNLYCE